MMKKKLNKEFFDRPTLQVARELLGKYLVREIGSKTIEAMITETEAYVGPNDLASHASRGPSSPAGRRTPRTEVMFGEPGYVYVYMIYGMYYCLNFVTEKKDYPAAVLIRGAIISKKEKAKSQKNILNGPGKLCRYFQIDKKFNGEDMVKSSRLWIEDRGIKLKPGQIKRAKRIGIDYAGEYKHKLWRFYIEYGIDKS